MKNTIRRQLTFFMTVAQHFHSTHVAEVLETTQPSISMQIKQLVD
jgi:DNA-binding transcriptional LysR family regulator